MKPLGTILPTAETLRLADDYASDQARKNAQWAKSNLSWCEHRYVLGEDRYYYGGNRYATVNNQKAHWFEIRKDGDYSIK